MIFCSFFRFFAGKRAFLLGFSQVTMVKAFFRFVTVMDKRWSKDGQRDPLCASI